MKLINPIYFRTQSVTNLISVSIFRGPPFLVYKQGVKIKTERERERKRERDRKFVYQDGTAVNPIEKVLVSEVFIPFIGSQ